MNAKQDKVRLENIETELFLAGIFRYYGYDFRDYGQEIIKARIRQRMLAERVSTVSRFQGKILHDPACLERFLRALSGSHVGMFGDTDFYFGFRSHVVPLLKTYPFVRIWDIACSSGHQAYAMAILLTEEGIYSRCRIYATDLSEAALRQARKGVLSRAAAEEYANNYLLAGGRRSFWDYCKPKNNRLALQGSIKRNIVFSQHNLVTDSSFNEFQVIVCRNVLSLFGLALQQRVHNLIFESLGRFGVLILGSSESPEALPKGGQYETFNDCAGFYQKIDHFRISRTVGRLSGSG
jgi:chemotaxis protein methyltransferase CheR